MKEVGSAIYGGPWVNAVRTAQDALRLLDESNPLLRLVVLEDGAVRPGEDFKQKYADSVDNPRAIHAYLGDIQKEITSRGREKQASLF